MGKTLKRLGRGVAAGLIVGGGIAQQKKADEEEKRRFDEQSARAERQLQMQEAESAARLEKNKLDVSIKRVQYNNNKFITALRESNFDPRVAGPAMNKNGTNMGYTWNYNAQDSAAAGEGVIIYDVGTQTMNPDGSIKMGPDGKPEVKANKGNTRQMRFDNQDDHVNFMLRSSSPEWALAHDQADYNATKARQLNEKNHRENMKNPDYALKYGNEQELAGLAIKGKKADIAKTQAETRKLDRGVATRQTPAQAPVSEFMSAMGNMKEQTAKDVEKAKAFAASWNKTGPGLENPVDPDDAARMMHLKNSKGGQKKIKQYGQEVLEGKMTEAEFKAKFSGSQLPAAFVDKMFTDIGAIPEEEVSSGNWFSNFFSSLFNN